MTVEAITLQRQFLKGAADTLGVQFYNDGVPADPGVTTVAVVSESGATVIASATATGGTGNDPRTVALTSSHTANLDRWVVTWTTASLGTHTVNVEVVGAYLFSIYEARRFDGGALESTSNYPTWKIEKARVGITTDFESITGLSFIPRYELVEMDAPLTSRLPLLLMKSNGDPALRVTRIRSIETRTSGTDTWTAFDSDELTDVLLDPWGQLRRESLGIFPSGYRNVRIGFEHGFASPPGDIPEAAMAVLRERLVKSGISARALSEINELGTVQYAVANEGLGRHYGIPWVDAELNRYAQKVPVVR